ncbi:hypothetical protein [Streptomyces sp. NRRL B-24085]|uniref:hypothetical protein n=1 Tax=Streptomyces sp. NRRL B-24085 TaxID=1709476 RepID=UPI000A7A6B2F|nr:hypothetical protein [Streptomyces sp. NRRL B-24085]
MTDQQPSAAELQQAVVGSLMGVIAAPDESDTARQAQDALTALEDWLTAAERAPQS